MRLDSTLRRLIRSSALAALAAAAVNPCFGDDAQGLFNKSCSSCHGADGKGQTLIGRKLGAKDLTQSKLSDVEIEKQVRNGRLTPDGRIMMPAFKDALTPEEMKTLIGFVKALRK